MSLKNPGSIACLMLSVLALYPAVAHALEIETTIEPQRVRVGTAAVLSVKISGAGSAEPVSIPPVDGLEISYSGTQRSFQFINGRTWSGIVLTFSVVPARSGSFSIPPLVIRAGGETLKSGAARLVAYQGEATPGTAAAGLRAEISLSKRRVYEGEPLLLRYYLLHSGVDLRDTPAFERLPQSKGALQKQIEENRPEETVSYPGGDYIKTHIATFAVIPAGKGKITAGGGALIVSVIDSDGFFSFPRSRRIEYPEEAVIVDPLPSAGKPADFQGDVGRFTLDAVYGAEDIKVFDEKKIKLIVRGRGNLPALSTPKLDAGEGLKILTETGAEKLDLSSGALEGEKEFIYTLIPEKAGRISLNGFSLSCFNPEAGRYEIARSGKIEFTVKDDPSRRKGAGQEGDEKPGGIVDVNYFIIAGIIFFIAGIVVLVIVWEKMRYRLAAKIASPERPQPAAGQDENNDEKLLRDMRAALRRSGDADLFLRTAEKIIPKFQDRLPEHGDPAGKTAAQIDEVRTRLYLYRYGGGQASPEVLEEIYASIKKIHDRMPGPDRQDHS